MTITRTTTPPDPAIELRQLLGRLIGAASYTTASVIVRDDVDQPALFRELREAFPAAEVGLSEDETYTWLRIGEPGRQWLSVGFAGALVAVAA
jgi:hypothetical protein